MLYCIVVWIGIPNERALCARLPGRARLALSVQSAVMANRG